MSKKIEIYAISTCRYCRSALALLDEKGVEYVEIDVANDPARRAEARDLSDRRTIPQIFIDGQSIGGYDALVELDDAGELDAKLGLERPPSGD